MPGLLPKEKLRTYQKILVNEFIREFNFLADVVAERATAKGDFTDKICKILTLGIATGTAVGGTVLDTIAPVVGTAVSSAVSAVAESGLDYLNAKRKESKLEHIGSLHDILTIQEEGGPIQQDKLRILLEEVAREAAHRYEYAILNILGDDPADSVIPFAKAGVERMLEYVARKQLPLTTENLLKGLIEGRSGAYVTGFTNTALATKDKRRKESDYTAEGIYGRSAFRARKRTYHTIGKDQAPHRKSLPDLMLTGKQIGDTFEKITDEHWKDLTSNSKWVKFKALITPVNLVILKNLTALQLNQVLESRYDYGYVHFEKEGQDLIPKYGYVNMRTKWIEYYGYQRVKREQWPKTVKAQLKQYQPRVQIVDREEVKNYAEEFRNNKTTQSFNAYVAGKYPGTELAACREDLTGVDLSGADFSGSDLSGSTITGSLAGTCFKGSYLVHTTFEKITSVKGAKFNGAHLEYLDAEDQDLSGVDFSDAHLNYANLKKTTLTNIAFRGADWTGAKLEGSKAESLSEILKEQDEAQKKLEQEMRTKFEKLKKKVDKQSGELKTLAETMDINFTKLKDKSQEQAKELQKITADLAEEQRLRETFERYCESELEEMREKVKNQKGEHQQSIQVLENQLVQLQTIQSELPNLMKTATALVTQIREHKAGEKELEKQIEKLEKKTTKYIDAQAKQMMELQQGLNDLNAKVIKLELQVEQLETRVEKVEEKQADEGFALFKAEEKVHLGSTTYREDKTPLSLSPTAPLPSTEQLAALTDMGERLAKMGFFSPQEPVVLARAKNVEVDKLKVERKQRLVEQPQKEKQVEEHPEKESKEKKSQVQSQSQRERLRMIMQSLPQTQKDDQTVDFEDNGLR